MRLISKLRIGFCASGGEILPARQLRPATGKRRRVWKTSNSSRSAGADRAGPRLDPVIRGDPKQSEEMLRLSESVDDCRRAPGDAEKRTRSPATQIAGNCHLVVTVCDPVPASVNKLLQMDTVSDILGYPVPPHRDTTTEGYDMTNAELKQDGDQLTITIDLSKEFGPSKSGKTIIIATSSGNQKIPGTDAIIGLNVYRKR
jgi:hypothetical protein